MIDEEVERILREQEARAAGCSASTGTGWPRWPRALLENETIDGAEVGRLVDEAYGRPVHESVQVVPRFADDAEERTANHTPAHTSPGALSSPRQALPPDFSRPPDLRPPDLRE